MGRERESDLRGDFQVECTPLKEAICLSAERLKNWEPFSFVEWPQRGPERESCQLQSDQSVSVSLILTGSFFLSHAPFFTSFCILLKPSLPSFVWGPGHTLSPFYTFAFFSYKISFNLTLRLRPHIAFMTHWFVIACNILYYAESGEDQKI